MQFCLRSGFSFLRRSWRLLALAVSLISGCLSGIYFAANADVTYLLMMRAVPGASVSIAGAFAAALLPFLIAAFAAFLSMPYLVFPVCFCKAFLYGACSWGVWVNYGGAAWLVGGLLQFGNLCLIPLLCWYSLRVAADAVRSLGRDFQVCCLAAAVVGIVDYCIVSPFLAMLINS